MSNDIAIKVENLSKIYRLYDQPVDRLKESLHPFKKIYHRNFYALQNLGFQINKGDTVGIIGKNGSGKSTLLKVITGVLAPSEGVVEVNGKVSALLELGTGFNPEYTGIENIFFNGTIMGFSREQIDNKVDAIIAFADIGDFINQPVRTYSSGMYVRLAFSVATNIDPEILIIDEALSVGDMFFQAKSMAKMRELMLGGATLLFVSHDVNAVKSICRKGILLDSGKMLDYDDSSKIVDQYLAMKFNYEVEEEPPAPEPDKDEQQLELENQKKEEQRLTAFSDNAIFLEKAPFNRTQNGKASLVNVQLLDEAGNAIEAVKYNQLVTLRTAVEIHEDITVLLFGYHIRDKNQGEAGE